MIANYDSVSAAQRAVLGLAVLGDSAAAGVCDRLRDDQLDPPARFVLEAIRQLLTESIPVEVITLTELLFKRGQLEAVGGRNVIDTLTTHACSVASIDVLCRDLAKAATWRDRAKAAQVAAGAAAAQSDEDWANALEQADADAGATGLETFTPAAWGEEIFQHIDGGTGLPDGVIATPWPLLNAGIFGGIWPGDVCVVLGHSNMGKTAVIGDIAHFAAMNGHRTHLYLTEDHGISRGSRILSRMTGVSTSRIMHRNLSDRDTARILDALGRGLPYGKTPCAGRTAQEICAHIRRSKWDLAIVDHLHDLAYRDERELSAMVLAFRAEANRGRTAIVLCAQPNATTANKDGRARLSPPSMHSAKGAKTIGDIANTFLTIHQEQDDEGVPTGEGKIRALKTRTSQYPTVEVTLDGGFHSFAPRELLEAA